MLVKAQGILWKDSITLQFVLSGYNAFLKVLCDPLVDKLYLNKNVLIHLFSLPLLLVFHAIYQRMNSHNKGFFFFLSKHKTIYCFLYTLNHQGNTAIMLAKDRSWLLTQQMS